MGEGSLENDVVNDLKTYSNLNNRHCYITHMLHFPFQAMTGLPTFFCSSPKGLTRTTQ